jgi:hypothetical protein
MRRPGGRSGIVVPLVARMELLRHPVLWTRIAKSNPGYADAVV